MRALADDVGVNGTECRLTSSLYDHGIGDLVLKTLREPSAQRLVVIKIQRCGARIAATAALVNWQPSGCRRRATQSQVVGVYHPFLSVRLAEHTRPAFQHVHRNLLAAWVLAALRMQIEHASPLVNAAEHRSTIKVAEVAPHPAACHTAERTRQWLNSLHA
jgi:hypothetical protein